MDAETVANHSSSLRRGGWQSAWSMATGGPDGGPSGGVAIMCRDTYGMREVRVLRPGRAVAAVLDLDASHSLAVVSLYGNVSLGLGEANTDLLEEVARFAEVMRRDGISTVIGGDFNLTPQNVADWAKKSSLNLVYTPPYKKRPAKGMTNAEAEL